MTEAVAKATSHKKNDGTITSGIQWIEPIDFDDPTIISSLEQARRALSNPRLSKILEVRTEIQRYLCDSLVAEGYVHPPVYMLSGCTDPLNHRTFPARINYYGKEVSITQSLIFQKILMVMLSPLEKVFWASPNIRMEMQIGHKEYKYASEFTQVDFEKRGGTYEAMLSMVSKLLAGLFRSLKQHHGDTIEELRGSPLPDLLDELPIFDAVEVKRQFGLADDDTVEEWGSRESGGLPFLVVNLKREAYDCYDPKRGQFLNYDVVIPPCGQNPHPIECLSGAERTRSLTDLKQRMNELGYPMSYFRPFFEIFRSLDPGSGAIATDAIGDGAIRCAGAGFGIERLTYAILGLKDIHDVYPFPRMAESKIAI